MARCCAIVLTALALFGCGSSSPADIDPALAAAIDAIQAIDNHAHPVAATLPGDAADNDFDALTLQGVEPSIPPLRIRSDNAEYVDAWRAIYDRTGAAASQPSVANVTETKTRALQEHGERYPVWVLQRVGIETMLANRVAMGRGLATPQFRWVAMVDPLIFPLSNDLAKRNTPDYRSFFESEERLLRRYLADGNLAEKPSILDGYLRTVVTPTLERQKQAGAVAVKFEAGYLRTLDFLPADAGLAAATYANFVNGGEPPAQDYKNLQDYLFRYISREASRLRLPVHIHNCYGVGSYYSMTGSHPLLLEATFNDPELRSTTFVLVHGGWPFTREAGTLLLKPNVYLDTSALALIMYPRAATTVLREWLELAPEKVLFGSDAAPFGPPVSWEETAWQGLTTVRKALALALTGMVRDQELSRERALEFARRVLRDNARALYDLP